MEALFTSSLGLWVVENVNFNTTDRRIDFEIGCQGAALACPACGAAGQPIHDRLHRSWRHLEALLHKSWVAWHAYAQRAACANCDTDRVHSRFFARRFA
ncbi:transposase family protein, partial [Verminephrobacter aporrectodeae]|uniref:transposase family protein n=1 Tax=Verminephrobacter aporrectodeae TaxID=1110389 RepID=UPI002243EEE6